MATTTRPATDADLPAILDIYNEQVLNSTATFDLEPSSPAAQREWVKQFSHPYVLLVAERRGEVLAWGCLTTGGAKPGYRYTTEDSVYVRADQRRSGLGRQILVALIEAATANGFHTIIARIADDNPASVRLHESLGFVHVGREREVGYKFERWLDVAVMQAALPLPA
ncbi:MAG: N-acetyltransferase family protein [Dehalococcoidia bacterium]|nr:N-acetyltransferase family protein [Dehalococcoidia bacterium]